MKKEAMTDSDTGLMVAVGVLAALLLLVVYYGSSPAHPTERFFTEAEEPSAPAAAAPQEAVAPLAVAPGAAAAAPAGAAPAPFESVAFHGPAPLLPPETLSAKDAAKSIATAALEAGAARAVDWASARIGKL